jgi:hypothetical protein
MSFSDGYGIQSELQVRKILERETDWKYEFTKNDKYDVDMQLFDWGEPPCDADSRSLTGYVEIEVASESSDWQTGEIPEYWPHVSFLKRKVRCWDNLRRSWGGLQQKARQTMYLKFNHELDNCFVAPVVRIFHDKQCEKTRRDASPPSKRQDVLCLPPDHESVTWGISDSIDAIVDYFDRIETEQQSLTSSVFASADEEND